MQEIVDGVMRGDAQSMEDLFTRNRGLLYRLSQRYKTACDRDRAVSEEDLIQAGYLGLVEAAHAWEPERGAWVSLASLYVRKHMCKALGLRGKRIRAEHGAMSLDEPIPGGDDAETTRMDLLEDTTAQPVDEDLLLHDLQRQVREAVQALDDPRMRYVVERHDFEGQTYRAISSDMGFSHQYIKQLGDKARRLLKKDQRIRELATAYALDQDTRFHAHKGVSGFNSSWSSVVEDAALWRIERRKQIDEMRERYQA